MTDLLAAPVKRASDIDVSKPLKNLIASTYASGTSTGGAKDSPLKNLQENLAELQRLRVGALIQKGAEKGELAFNANANYLDQIVSLEQKIPSHEVQIPFKWRDAFDRGSIFGGRISLVINSLSYEKVCVLFNCGALASSVAAEQNLDSTDGMQKAMKRLQVASGIFKTLQETVVGLIQQDPTPDLEPDTLGVLADLMLAQAQEMIILKAIHDHMKPLLVAKLCSQAEDLFANVMRAMQKENVRGLWDAHWLPNICGKQAIYNGLAQYHQALVCDEKKIIGEQIARLEYAKTLFAAGLERGGSSDLVSVKDWMRRTDNKLAEAKKDNDFIYHERIPEVKSLATIGKAVVAKATLPVPSPLGVGGGKDLFEDLCPVALHQAVTAFEGRKQEMTNGEMAKLKDATHLMNELLSSMNLPAAIEETSGQDIPQSLKDKATAVVEAGGLRALEKLISELPELLTRNTEILDECERLLKEERESDEQLRNQFKDKWNRTASASLTATFTANATKYRTIINNAKQADSVVKEKMDSHKKGIEMLSKGPSSLQSAVPSSGQGQSVQGSPTVTKLRELMEQVETIKAERQVIEAELKGVEIDIKPVFFEALHKKGIIPEQELSMESLGRVFGPLQKQTADNLSRQESVMGEVQRNHEIFAKDTGAGAGGNAREDLLKSIAAAHDAFFELKGNLQEGTKFYNDLTQLLVTFQNKVSDFCFARKTEKDELMKDLTSGMASMTVGATPTPPAHHTPTTPTSAASGGQDEEPSRPPRKNDPPSRPPPPAVNPYAGAPSTQAATAPPTASAAAAPPNPYAGAPQGYAPYPPVGATPMPYPAYTPMPAGYNPYAAYGQQPGYPPAGYPPQGGYPQQPGYPPAGYPPQGYPPYPPQPGQPGQPPQGAPGQGPQWR